MATFTSTEIPHSVHAGLAGPQPLVSGRRRITPQAGHALEILGHAIEYLTDEFVQEGGSLSPGNGRLEAIQILMALNRAVYFECPMELSFGERCRSLLGLKTA